MSDGEKGYQDELWDVYDWQRRPTGKTHPRGLPMAPGEYHLVVHVCIFNSLGQLLIQKRHPAKKGWPGYWDLSAAGAVIAGEDTRQAAVREVREELGVELDLAGLRPRFTYYFKTGFDDFWIVQRDLRVEELVLQAEEVSAARWVDEAELKDLARRGEMIPYVFIDILFHLRDAFDAMHMAL